MTMFRAMPLVVLIVSSLVASMPGVSDAAVGWEPRDGGLRRFMLRRELVAQNRDLPDDIRTRKYDKMAVTPFTFYRGSAHVYYKDLYKEQLITASAFYRSDASTWLQGDLHVQNYGAFDNDDEVVVFDLNDFDESWIASYLYDLWRCAVSLVLVADENGLNAGQTDALIDAFVEEYLDRLETYRGNDDEKDEQITSANAYGPLDNFLEDAEDRNSRPEMLDDWSIVQDGRRIFDLGNPDLGALDQSDKQAITAAIDRYKDELSSDLRGDAAYFEVLDVAARLDAGTGSLGTPRYYALIQGASADTDDDRILDIKEQGLPSVFPYLDRAEQRSLLDRFDEGQQGCRVAAAQRALLTDVDDHLGCADLFGASYSVRERSPFKESLDTEEVSVGDLTDMAEQWGWVLAIDHARADRDYDADLVPVQFEDVMHDIADGLHDELRAEVRELAKGYAGQVVIDHGFFLQLRDRGRLD